MQREEMSRAEKPRHASSSETPQPARPVRRAWVLLSLALVTLAGIGIAACLLMMRPVPKREVPERSTEPASPPRIAGTKWLDEYAKLEANDVFARHRMVLEQVAAGNLPDTWNEWVPVTVTGRKGTVVQFEASPHGLRIGSTRDWVEVPLDGPHFSAVAELLSCELASAWMVEQIHLAPADNHKAIHFFAATELAHSLGYKDWEPNAPDGRKMTSATFFRQRSALLRGWLTTHEVPADALVSGYFKSVVPPIDGVTRKDGLEMIGGYTDAGGRIQGLSGGFHNRIFFDYSHNIRLIRGGLRVNGESMSSQEFFGNVSFAREFGFRATTVPVPAYPYPPELVQWMDSQKEAVGTRSKLP